MSADGLRRRVRALNRLPTEGTRAAAKKVEQLARETGSAIGPVSLGKKGRRVKLSAVSRFKGSGNHVEATVWGRPTGPWVWVTAGTGAHQIPKSGRRGKGRTTRYLKAPTYSHPIGRPVTHPGANGKGAWRRVVRSAETAVPETYVDAIRRLIGN